MNKLKILVIPSWYPNKKDPLWGNYFIKQAEALSSYADITMLYVNRIGLKDIKNFISEKKTDGFDNNKNYKFYKTSIFNLKRINLKLSYKIYTLSAYRAYRKIIKKYGKFDVIFVQSALPAGMAALYINKQHNVPYVVHAHAESIFTKDIYKKYIKDIIDKSKSYLAVNNSIKEKISKFGKECEIVPNFIDCKKFDINVTKNNKDFTLVSVCNFSRLKALDVILKALNIVIYERKIKDIKLKIVGTGESREFYENICRNLKLENYVEFVGYVDNDKLPIILNKCDALCVSSTFETFCIPIIEALSCGIPVISTDCDGPKEIFKNNDKLGIMVPINDVERYADAIVKLKNNYSKYKSSELKKYAFDNYDKSIICKKIINICKEK